MTHCSCTFKTTRKLSSNKKQHFMVNFTYGYCCFVSLLVPFGSFILQPKIIMANETLWMTNLIVEFTVSIEWTNKFWNVRLHDRTAPWRMLVTGNFPADGPSISFGNYWYWLRIIQMGCFCWWCQLVFGWPHFQMCQLFMFVFIYKSRHQIPLFNAELMVKSLSLMLISSMFTLW